jgi:hypothetical protein
MPVIGLFQLVLDDDLAISPGITGSDVSAERPYGYFGLHQLQVEREGFTEQVKILRQPRGEVVSFMGPESARLNVLQSTKIWGHFSPPLSRHNSR